MKKLLAIITSVVLSLSIFTSNIYSVENGTDSQNWANGLYQLDSPNIQTEGQGTIINYLRPYDPSNNVEGCPWFINGEFDKYAYLAWKDSPIMMMSAVTASDETSGQCGENVFWEYNTTNGVLSLSGQGDMWDYSDSNAPWYSFRSKIRKIEFGSEISSIGNNAFEGCWLYDDVIIPGNIKKIGEEAFSYSDCKNVIIENGTETICGGAFHYCDRLKSISLPDSITIMDSTVHSEYGEYDKGIFYNCESLKEIQLPNNLSKISAKMFEDCESLQKINIPQSVKVVEYGAFFGCRSIVSMIFDNSITLPEPPSNNLFYGMFNGCTSLQEVRLPNTLTKIYDYMFYGCRSLNSIEFPSGITSIGKLAFYGTNLASVFIPEGVDNIGESAFTACSNLTHFTVHDNNISFFAEDGVLFENAPTGVQIKFYPGGKQGAYTIPSGVGIGESAFKECKGLTAITIPGDIKEIPKRTFSGLSNLSSLTLNEGIEKINDGAFSQCNLTGELVIPSTVTYIGNYAFAYNKLSSVTFKGDDCDIRCRAFSSNEISSIVLPEHLTRFDGFDGNLLTELTLPESVTVFGCGAVMYNDSLTHITLPENLAAIEYKALYCCSNLTEDIIVPSSVKKIDDRALSYGDNSGEKVNIFFEGNAPASKPLDTMEIITGSYGTNAILYYRPGTTGWTDSIYYNAENGTWNGYSLKPWEDSAPGTYVSLKPENGSADFGYDNKVHYTVGFDAFTIKFNKLVKHSNQVLMNYRRPALLDFSKGTISLYKSTGELVWKAEQGKSYESGTTGTVVLDSDRMTMSIEPENHDTVLLEYDTEYYIVIDPGVIQFENGTTFAGIKKGEWTFKTIEEKLDHEHKAAVWESDGTSHWHTCEICGRRYDSGNHELDRICKCLVCGKVAHVPAPDRLGVVAATCTEEGYTGDIYCENCLITIEEGTKTSPLGHDLHWVGNDNNPYHWNRCLRCYHSLSKEEHTFNDKGKCTVCGANDPTYLQNPAGFVRTAWKYVGYNGEEMFNLFELDTGYYNKNNEWRKRAWCDKFVYFIAQECRLDGAINTQYLGGQAYLGQKVSYPQPGDLVFFDWKNNGGVDHVGIVSEVKGNQFAVIHGNYHTSSYYRGIVCGPNNTAIGRACVKNHSIPYNPKAMNSNAYWDVNDNEVEKFIRIDWDNIPESKATNINMNIGSNAQFSIERNGEVLSSNGMRLMALDDAPVNTVSFGYYTINEDGSYDITIDYHNDYNFSMVSLGNGAVDLDVKYYDFDGNLLNSVSFRKVAVTDTSVIETSPFNEFGSYELYVIDGDNEIVGWTADQNETVTSPDAEFTEYLNHGEENQPDGDEPSQPLPVEHFHSFTTWQYNSERHWQNCYGCSAIANYSEHTFIDGVCSVCGYVSEAEETEGVIEIETPSEGKIIMEDLETVK